MNRRKFLQTAGLVFAGAATARAFPVPTHDPDGWRFYQVDTEVEILHPVGGTQIWVPRPLLNGEPFQREAATYWRCHDGSSRCVEDQSRSLGIIHAEFAPGARPYIKVTSQIACRDWSVDLSKPPRSQKPNKHEVANFLDPQGAGAQDDIVSRKAAEITAGRHSDIEKAHAIYEWIVANTYRNPATRGCGTGDIRFMLESGDLGGKCADLNALFVGLARAAGLPAREVYGIRIAPSQLGYKSLGASSSDITRAQHCRAEVFLQDYGWVPADPADVRKVMLEEPPGHLDLTSTKVEQARNRLFGSWEMNWMAYNYSQDVALPGSKGERLRFFMYPQAETEEGRVDSLDPQNFRYTITTREIML